MTTKTKPARAVPEMLPREKLTKKAFAAISKYAAIRADHLNIHHKMVGYVLEAERMRRADLYKWLESKGYKWLPKHGFWSKE